MTRNAERDSRSLDNKPFGSRVQGELHVVYTRGRFPPMEWDFVAPAPEFTLTRRRRHFDASHTRVLCFVFYFQSFSLFPLFSLLHDVKLSQPAKMKREIILHKRLKLLVISKGQWASNVVWGCFLIPKVRPGPSA